MKALANQENQETQKNHSSEEEMGKLVRSTECHKILLSNLRITPKSCTLHKRWHWNVLFRFFYVPKKQMEDRGESLGQCTDDKKHSNQLNSQNEGKREAQIQ